MRIIFQPIVMINYDLLQKANSILFENLLQFPTLFIIKRKSCRGSANLRKQIIHFFFCFCLQIFYILSNNFCVFTLFLGAYTIKCSSREILKISKQVDNGSLKYYIIIIKYKKKNCYKLTQPLKVFSKISGKSNNETSLFIIRKITSLVPTACDKIFTKNLRSFCLAFP